jgi:hypothetical protein
MRRSAFQQLFAQEEVIHLTDDGYNSDGSIDLDATPIPVKKEIPKPVVKRNNPHGSSSTNSSGSAVSPQPNILPIRSRVVKKSLKELIIAGIDVKQFKSKDGKSMLREFQTDDLTNRKKMNGLNYVIVDGKHEGYNVELHKVVANPFIQSKIDLDSVKTIIKKLQHAMKLICDADYNDEIMVINENKYLH